MAEGGIGFVRQVIAFPDAELVVVTYLAAQLAGRPEPYTHGVVVSTRLPPGQSPGRHVRVRRAGGVATGLVVDQPRVDIQVWHDTDHDRMALAQLLRGLLLAAEGQAVHGVSVYRVDEFAGPTPLPDPADSSRSIIQFTVAPRLRGTAIG